MIEFELSEASPIRKSYGTGQFSMGASAAHNQGSAMSQAAARQSQYSGTNHKSGTNQVGSSSVNLEKAYEELEKEIAEIKQKLHQSIN
jgi:hypothetical protein